MTDGRRAGPGELEIRRAADQFVTERDSITTRHCFAFGDHYDPARVSLRSLVALNDERLAPGAGYPMHPHRDVDIVTWVMEGSLLHADSLGTTATIRPATVQRLTAGTGVTHRETNGGGHGEPLRFLQLWFALDDAVAPSYESRTHRQASGGSGYMTIAASTPTRSSTTLAAPGIEAAVCHLPRGTAGLVGGGGHGVEETFTYVAAGRLEVVEPNEMLGEGDSVRSVGPAVSAAAVADTVLLRVSFSAAARGR